MPVTIPVVIDPSSFTAGAPCNFCAIPPGLQLPTLISIFAKLANMPLDPSTLMADAVCVHACVPGSYQMPVLIALAQKIVDLGGGLAGGGQLLVYSGASPTADGLVPTNQNQGAIAYKVDGTGPTFSWDTSAHVWV